MIACSVCGEIQYQSESGVTCSNGHGGAPGVERHPDAVFLEATQQRAYLAQLRTYIEKGGTPTREQLLWLVELASGGVWGRWVAGLMGAKAQLRTALQALVVSLVTRESERWTAANWRPIIALLEPSPLDPEWATINYPAVRALDRGVRIVEQGEGRE